MSAAETAKSYEALVRVRNSDDGFEQDNVKIWMNNPLRYAGYTFYQSGYIGDSRSGIETTTLQVVSNQRLDGSLLVLHDCPGRSVVAIRHVAGAVH